MSPPIDIRHALRLGGQVWAVLAALYVGLLLLATRGQAQFADGYDGIGFVLAVSDFDLSRFQPHPPGFPLFVLGARALRAIFGVSPALAVALCSALLLPLGLAAVAAWLAVRSGAFAAWLFALLAGANVLVCGLGLATLSDGAGLGLTLASVAVVAASMRTGSISLALLAGCLGGCALGIRPQSAALLGLSLCGLLAYAHHQQWPWLRPLAAFVMATAAATLAWLLPLLLHVGPQRFWDLCMQHARGHFTDFGGRAWTVPAEPGGALSRLSAVARALVASLGPILLMPLAIVGLGLRRAWRDLGLRADLPSALMLAVTLAYLGYVLLVARVVGDGRHLLPLPVGVAAALAPLLARLGRGAWPRRALLLILVGLAALNARAVYAFRHSPAAGLQLASALPDCGARVYGARAARYVDLVCGSGSAQPALYLGEVLSDIERRSSPPPEVLLTSEVVASAASQRRLRWLGTYCPAADVPSILRFDTSTQPRHPARASAVAPGCVELLAYRVLP